MPYGFTQESISKQKTVQSWNMFTKKLSPIQYTVYTRLHGYKYEFSKKIWGGVHQIPSPDPSPTQFRALPFFQTSPSILGHFAPLVRASFSINLTPTCSMFIPSTERDQIKHWAVSGFVPIKRWQPYWVFAT